MRPGPTNTLTDVPGFGAGHATRTGDGWLTGTTVVLAPEGGAVGGVDVRGGAPGTRETDLLDPGNLVDRVDAVVLTGGSAFGLAAGTVALSAATLMGVCLDLGDSLAASGFRKLVFVNGHGGQPSLLDVVARDIRVRTGLEVFPMMPSRLGLPEGVEPVDPEYGIHGGQIETSIVWALAPELGSAFDAWSSARRAAIEEELLLLSP